MRTAEREYSVGHELVDEFLEFASGRARPSTVRAYAHDLSVFFRVVGKEPADVTAKDVLRFHSPRRRSSSRHFAGQVTEADPACTSMAGVERRHIEAHKLWLAARPGKAGKPLSAVTIRHRLGILRTFFERLRRLGLRRRTEPDADLPRRLPPSRRAAAQVPRRPDHGEVHGRPGERSRTPVGGSWSRSWPRPASE